MKALVNGNLALRFALELFALAAIGYWGWETGDGVMRGVLALAAPLLVAVVWGRYLSPRRAVELGRPLRFALELLVFAAAAAALAATGQVGLAIVLALLAVVSGTINLLMPPTGFEPVQPP